MSGEIKIFDGKNFESEVLKSEIPVLVDFYAAWCGPCKAMTPVLEEVAKEIGGRAVIGKIDVDENGELAGKFAVNSVPTMLIFSKGEAAERIVGISSKRAILEKLNSI